MKRLVKQVVGIDVAQNELVVSLGRMDEQLDSEVFAHKIFPNTAKGFTTLLAWVEKLTNTEAGVRFVMEATGVYHEALAYFLAERGQELSVVLPNKISNYFRTLSIKTITDKTASEAIVRFGLERKLENWQRPKSLFKRLRQLTRERDQGGRTHGDKEPTTRRAKRSRS
ncbi:transposase [Flavihumibacter sp. ZG627]|uniref:IS110 family transposase n=1 Tax=Flavihumibacter sp. ZG627 TaxID=1463156 RepID=UPI001C102883|nr:transposase [Flavihumibacter sp. ZG627]